MIVTGRDICSPSQPCPRRTDFAHSPLIVFYEVTRACDLVCRHCRACAQPACDPNELSPELSRRLLDQLAEFPKPPMLVLTGGDPLKRNDIYELVKYATGRGLSVAVTPSATPLVTGRALWRLKEAGMQRLALSLDGADAKTHDATRGVRGSFERTLQILANARASRIPVQINTTLTPENYCQIEAMAALLAEQRIVLWSVFFLVPVGRAAGGNRLSPRQYEGAFAQLYEQALVRQYGIKTTEAPQYRRYVIEQQKRRREVSKAVLPDSKLRLLGVNDGKGVMFISHTGMIHPSGFMPIVCGVFPLENVVRVYQKSEIFCGLRDASRLQGKCGVCEYRHICGGSRARAYAVTGDPYAGEPDCDFTPAALRKP